MSHENSIQLLKRKISDTLPDASVRLVVPRNQNGVWSLDASLKGHWVVVEWKHDKGFGVTADETHGFGERADEVYMDLDSAFNRVLALLQLKKGTTPPEPVRLRELRESLGFSQEVLASQLGVRQAAISKTESRDDMLLSTLRSLVEAMGGRLILKVGFPDDGVERELKLNDVCKK